MCILTLASCTIAAAGMQEVTDSELIDMLRRAEMAGMPRVLLLAWHA